MFKHYSTAASGSVACLVRMLRMFLITYVNNKFKGKKDSPAHSIAFVTGSFLSLG